MNQIKLLWLVVVGLAPLIVGCKHTEPAKGSADQRRIADACLHVLHSPLAQEPDIDPADARLPEVIRSLHPVHVEVGAGMVVVSFALQDGLTEYHLAPVSTEPGTWLLYGAGPKYQNQHHELLRFQQTSVTWKD
jgi:hypothetical protein